MVYEVLPPLLKQGGKISNPYPNADAIMVHWNITIAFGILIFTRYCLG
jgi:hypothetical protein